MHTMFGGLSSVGWLGKSRSNILVKEPGAGHRGGSGKVKDPALQSLTLWETLLNLKAENSAVKRRWALRNGEGA